jgi:hypothetical protein
MTVAVGQVDDLPVADLPVGRGACPFQNEFMGKVKFTNLSLDCLLDLGPELRPEGAEKLGAREQLVMHGWCQGLELPIELVAECDTSRNI